jgi:CRP/FNR family transcriptional regulator, transcriptional activator FtrB
MNNLVEIVPTADRAGRLQTLADEIPLLASLPAATRERLLKNARVERLGPRAVLLKEGEVPKDLHIVLSGSIDLSCTYKSHECTAMILSAGDVSMPAAALFQEHYLISARTLTATRVLMIDAKDFREEARRSPELALGVARIISGQWRLALKIILDLKCRTPSQRLASFLLRLYDAGPPGSIAEVPFSKRQLASRVGMQPETLSRTLQTLAANGLFLRGREIVLKDRSAIEAFCGPDPYPSGDEEGLGVYAL